MIDQQRWKTYLGINLKDRTLHLCKQNAEAFFVTMKFTVDHAVFTDKTKGEPISDYGHYMYIYKAVWNSKTNSKLIMKQAFDL